MTNQQSSAQMQPQFTFEGGHLVMYHQQTSGLPQVADPTVNDRDRTFDLLATEKYLTTEYHTAMLEASDEGLYQVFKQCQDHCHQLQRQLFKTAFQKGWYRLPVAEAPAIVSAFSQFQQCQNEFPFPIGQKLHDQTKNLNANGQWPQVNETAQSRQSAMMQQQGGAKAADQQLQHQVGQAMQQAQQGQMPAGYAGKTH